MSFKKTDPVLSLAYDKFTANGSPIRLWSLVSQEMRDWYIEDARKELAATGRAPA